MSIVLWQRFCMRCQPRYIAMKTKMNAMHLRRISKRNSITLCKTQKKKKYIYIYISQVD